MKLFLRGLFLIVSFSVFVFLCVSRNSFSFRYATNRDDPRQFDVSEIALDSKTGEFDTETPPEFVMLTTGERLTRAELSAERTKEIQILATPSRGASEIPEFELPMKEIRTVEEAYFRIKDNISSVVSPRVFFYDGDYWYFSGGGRSVLVNDFSDGYRISKTGSISTWYERNRPILRPR